MPLSPPPEKVAPSPKARKPHKSNRPVHPDFRHQVPVPLPPNEAIERQLHALLSPALLAARALPRSAPALRDRVLTLPVVTAIVVSLVWRKMAYLSEAVRVLAREGLLWAEAQPVSKQALSRRLQTLPAALFADLLERAVQALNERAAARPPGPRPPAGPDSFACLWAADASTLERVRRACAPHAPDAHPLGGTMLAVVELAAHRPVAVRFSPNPAERELHWAAELAALLPAGGLLVLDRGFFQFALFDQLSGQGRFFVTRWREQVAFRTLQVLGQGPCHQDRVVRLGLHHTHPCRHPVRLVSVLWAGTWRHYATNVLDPARLSARQVVELYQRRWRIEDAFLLTKRLLGLSYLWVGGANGVELQVYATWLVYLALNEACAGLAAALSLPIERISVEMVFRGLYHFRRAIERGEADDLVAFYVAHHKLLGLVKAERKRHRQQRAQSEAVWSAPASGLS